MSKYIYTKMHVYNMRTGSDEYRALCDSLKGVHEMHALSVDRDHSKEIEPGVYTVALETTHVFDNQWNTADDAGDEATRGRRVFDWYEALAPHSRGVVHTGRGHWLEITDEMRALRHDTVGCGYCGKQRARQDAPVFCGECLDSEYLKEADLPLLRLLPVDAGFRAERAPLTDTERADLVPRFRAAQLHGSTERGRARIAKQRQDIMHKAACAISNATDECNGLLWLLDHGVNISNVIYYSHTGRFCFGWCKPVDAALYGELCEILTEFPFDYDIEREG
ncbi:MAG: hypothetical protein KGL39_09590 [Patescibacteria group bacterium]|nr:hypothetical protein [Patescibacteria group bacterium]